MAAEAMPGDTYGAYIKDQLTAEMSRRTVIDARGLSLITTSGALVTLVFALSAFSVGKSSVPTVPTRWLIACVVVFFAAAALLGLIGNAARKYDVARGEALLGMVDDRWGDDDALAKRSTAYIDATTTVTLRAGNNRKSMWIQFGFAAQLLAVALLAAAIIVQLAAGKFAA